MRKQEGDGWWKKGRARNEEEEKGRKRVIMRDRKRQRVAGGRQKGMGKSTRS